MKFKITLFTILFVFSSDLFANAKVIGNGGNVVACKDTGGNIISIETLDLFEGRAVYGLNYKEDYTPALEQALRYSDAISKYLGSPVSAVNLSQDVKDLHANLRFLPPGVGLKPINDIGTIIVPKNCEIVQTINYRDWKKIYVDSDIWNLLSETQKASLLLHEAIYAFYREGFSGVVQEETSARTRFAVASLMSGAVVQPVDELVNPKGKEYLHCRTNAPVTEFFYYIDQKDQAVVQFRFYADHIVLTRTWMSAAKDSKVITGDLISPLEDDVRMQVSFNTLKSGTISYLSTQDLSPGKFTCNTLNRILN
ncbi:MAG: hypothetical protein V4654_12290 [Bdellovibrionota bacterium]